jgi:hypothetical protein
VAQNETPHAVHPPSQPSQHVSVIVIAAVHGKIFSVRYVQERFSPWNAVVAVIMLPLEVLFSSTSIAWKCRLHSAEAEDAHSVPERVGRSPFAEVHSADVHSAFGSWQDSAVVICMEQS